MLLVLFSTPFIYAGRCSSCMVNVMEPMQFIYDSLQVYLLYPHNKYMMFTSTFFMRVGTSVYCDDHQVRHLMFSCLF
jgi:hypothetical protein